MHHVAWDKVCQPKYQGGLGIRKLEVTNQIALARLCWRMLSNLSHVWSQVLTAKYGGLSDLQHLCCRAASSHTWRSIRKGWELLKVGLRWQVGDGSTCLFWTANWVEDVSLVSLSVFAPPDSWLARPVSFYWNAATGWSFHGFIPTLVSHFWLKSDGLPCPQGMQIPGVGDIHPLGVLRLHQRARSSLQEAVIMITRAGPDCGVLKVPCLPL